MRGRAALAANVRTGPIVGLAKSGIGTIYFPSIDPCVLDTNRPVP